MNSLISEMFIMKSAHFIGTLVRSAQTGFTLTNRIKPQRRLAENQRGDDRYDRFPYPLASDHARSNTAQSRISRRATLAFTAAILQLTAAFAQAVTTTIPPIEEYSPLNVPNMYSLSLMSAAAAGVAAECRPGTGNYNCALTSAYIYPTSPPRTFIAEYIFFRRDYIPPYDLLGPYNHLTSGGIARSCPP